MACGHFDTYATIAEKETPLLSLVAVVRGGVLSLKGAASAISFRDGAGDSSDTVDVTAADFAYMSQGVKDTQGTLQLCQEAFFNTYKSRASYWRDTHAMCQIPQSYVLDAQYKTKGNHHYEQFKHYALFHLGDKPVGYTHTASVADGADKSSHGTTMQCERTSAGVECTLQGPEAGYKWPVWIPGSIDFVYETDVVSARVKVQVWGGCGGDGRGGDASGAGYAEATFDAPMGTVLTYVVGSSGKTSERMPDAFVAGIYGGGPGENLQVAKSHIVYSGGGGFSAVFLGAGKLTASTETQARVIALAGGSGGSANDGLVYGYGGPGGGLEGGKGVSTDDDKWNTLGGRGGTQTAGGAPPRDCCGGQAGSLLQGGHSNSPKNYAGAGGGGYFGGSAGSSNGGLDQYGGGGSGHVKTGALNAEGYTIKITDSRMVAAEAKQAGRSAGNGEPNHNGAAGEAGNNGQVVITVDGVIKVNAVKVSPKHATLRIATVL